MQITSITLSTENQEISLTITDAAAVTTLYAWKENTFQDFDQAIDLSAKLTGAATENITITPADVNEQSFDGIYFIEAQDPTETSLEYVSQISRYKECVLGRLIKLNECSDCLNDENVDLYNVALSVIGLEYALTYRFIDEILSITATLDKYCSSACLSCDSFTTVSSTNDTAINDSSKFIINIDGGGAT